MIGHAKRRLSFLYDRHLESRIIIPHTTAVNPDVHRLQMPIHTKGTASRTSFIKLWLQRVQ
jgi:hypothetical protein